jgi:hypothetical protein
VGNINNAFRQALAAQGLSAAPVTVAFGPEGLVLKRYQRPGGLVPSYPPADVGRY